MSADPFTIKQGDTLENLVRTLKNSDGSIMDLTNATVKFTMRLGANAPKVDEQSVDTLDGQVEDNATYVWQDGDTDTPGTYDSEYEVTFQGGEILTVPNDGHMSVTVTPALA